MEGYTSVELIRCIIAVVVIVWVLIYMTYNQPPGGYSNERSDEYRYLYRTRAKKHRK